MQNVQGAPRITVLIHRAFSLAMSATVPSCADHSLSQTSWPTMAYQVVHSCAVSVTDCAEERRLNRVDSLREGVGRGRIASASQ